MTATYATTATATAPTGSLRLFGTGLAAAAVASVATPVVAAVGNAVGISLDIAGEPIPVPGFATLTAVFSTIGVVMALVMAKLAGHPQRAFVRTTVVLTALSLVPDLIVDAATTTRALLMLTHLIAAAIVIPAIARLLAA